MRNIHGKNNTFTVESVNADLCTYIPILKRRSRCFARKIETLGAVHTSLTMSELGRMVNELPEKYASVFLLRYKHDLSDAAIARLLKLTEPAVRKRLQRAKEKIAEQIQLRGDIFVGRL